MEKSAEAIVAGQVGRRRAESGSKEQSAPTRSVRSGSTAGTNPATALGLSAQGRSCNTLWVNAGCVTEGLLLQGISLDPDLSAPLLC